MNIEEIKRGIVQEVTAAVVAKLPDEAKAQVVAEALKDVIGNYEFKRAVEAKLKTAADVRLDALLKNVEFDKLLCKKFQEGVDLFMAALPKAVAAAMVGTLVGPSEYKTGAVYRGLLAVLGLEKDR